MKRLLLGLSIVIGAWMLSPTPEAQAWRRSNNGSRGNNGNNGNNGHTSKAGVPELDPSAAGSAIVLLLGGMAYIASRRREEDVA
jgi:hypothetical protein